jgi:hypothetical protein
VLEDWIKEKKYLQVVTVKQGAPITQLVEIWEKRRNCRIRGMRDIF